MRQTGRQTDIQTDRQLVRTVCTSSAVDLDRNRGRFFVRRIDRSNTRLTRLIPSVGLSLNYVSHVSPGPYLPVYRYARVHPSRRERGHVCKNASSICLLPSRTVLYEAPYRNNNRSRSARNVILREPQIQSAADRTLEHGHGRSNTHRGCPRGSLDKTRHASLPGTTSLAYWMTHHPALKWVSNAKRNHPTPPGEESHVFDGLTDAAHETMVKLSLLPNGEGSFAKTAPVAVLTDKVIDCKFSWCAYDALHPPSGRRAGLDDLD